MEPPPASDLEVFQDNPNHLHRLVSEGDVSGVRLVHQGANLHLLALSKEL